MVAASKMALVGGIYGSRLGRQLDVGRAPAIAARTSRGSLQLAVTRLRRDATAVPNPRGPATPLPRARAFIVTARLRDHTPAREPQPSDEPVHPESYADGSVSVFDLEREPLCETAGPFDCLYFYVPRSVLDELADDSGAPRIETLSWPRGVPDPVVVWLGSCLVPTLDRPERASPLFVDHVARALLAHFAQAYGGMWVAPCPAAGGLASWQERRAKEMLTARLDGHVPLAEVALACCFADQSHFTRVFTRAIGTSPGAWRRARSGHGGRAGTEAPGPAVDDGGVQRAA